MSQTLASPLEAAHRALERHAWQEAYELFRAAEGAGGLDAEDLEALAEAAWWSSHPQDAISVRERAFAQYVAADERRRAAMIAMRLANDRFSRLDTAVGRSWLRRAEQLLADDPESVEYGHLLLAKSRVARWEERDLEKALALTERAVDFGTRLGDRDLQALGLAFRGAALIAVGRVDEGMALYDEAMVAAVGGELKPFSTGLVYCLMIGTCQDLADYRRAGEWTEAAARWCERQSISGFPGVCRVHRAEIIRLKGAWGEAEEEAVRACRELRDFELLDLAGEGFHQIGEIRVRMGDLEAAEDAFAQAHELGADPQPGLAMLRLIQGKPEAAISSLTRSLSESATEALPRARLLPTLTEAAIAVGDLDRAGEAVAELEELSSRYGSAALHAATHQARGRLRLAEGDPGAAIRDLSLSRKHWQETDAPYEAALARMTLAQAYQAAGDDDAAVLELRAAKSAFVRLGARLDAARASELLRTCGFTVASTERHRRTFMFTDIVGSTTLLEAIGDDSWQDLRRWHDQTLRSLIEEHGGEVVQTTGDGFFAAFPDCPGAVGCAVAIQRRLAEHRRTHGFAPQVRVGLHGAEATRLGEDYAGLAVHQAARIGALATAGEILISAGTAEAEPPGVPLRDERLVSLKGMAEPVRVAAVDWRPPA